MLYHGFTFDPDGEKPQIERGVREGSEFEIWEYEMDDPGVHKDHASKVVEKLPGEQKSHRTQWVTGGLSGNLGTAAHFSTGISDHGIVVYVDENRLPNKIEQIKYNTDWFSMNPGVYSRVDSLHDGEVHVNGKLYGGVSIHADGKKVVMDWGERVWTRAEEYSYQSEDEYITFDPELKLKRGAVGAAVFVSHDSPDGASMGQFLDTFDGYYLGYGGRGDDRNVESMSAEERTRAVYEEMNAIAGVWSGQVAVVVVENMNRVQKENETVPREQFKWVYDGSRIIENYEEATPYVGELAPPTLADD